MERKDTKSELRTVICEYALNNYGTQPEYLWMSYPDYAVLRRADNKKWYAIIMDVPKNKLGLIGEERVDILDIKCSSALREILTEQKGFLPAYHMNRENWITVLLDGSVDRKTVLGLLDESYEMAKGKSKKSVGNKPTSRGTPHAE